MTDMINDIADKIINDHIQLMLENNALRTENETITQLLIKAKNGLEYGMDAQATELYKARQLYTTQYKPQRLIFEEDALTAIQDALDSINQFFGPRE